MDPEKARMELLVEVNMMKNVRLLLTGLTVLLLLSMTVAPAAFAAKGKNSGGSNSGEKSSPAIVWPPAGGGGGGGGGNSSSKGNGNPGNFQGNSLHLQNNVVHTPTVTQNFVKPGTFVPKGTGAPTFTPNNLVVKPGTFVPKGTGAPTFTPNNLVLKPGTLTTTGQQPGVTLNKSTLTNQKLTTALKTLGKDPSLTQTQLSALAKALQTKNVKAPIIKDLNLSNADIQLLLNLVSADVTAGDSSSQIISDIASLFNSFGSGNGSSSNKDSNDDENDDDSDDNSSSPAPAILYPYSFIPGYNYSFIGASSSMYVDGFGPVAVESVQLSNGQTVQIPAPPYNQSMAWGSFGTYANWAAQFQAQNGRAPTDQDAVNFWISQAVSGQLRISPTP
jgi:hypothetical protein